MKRMFVLTATTIALGVASTAQCDEVFTPFPSAVEPVGIPLYARVEPSGVVHTDLVPHTSKWAAIIFYRLPQCVPSDFNLLDLFDIPRVLGCGLTVHGYEQWQHGPGIDPAPNRARIRGNGALPIWFVPWRELSAAADDGNLTIADIRNIPGIRRASASFYTEELFPSGNTRPYIEITAVGMLEDGDAFLLRHKGGKNREPKSKIRFFERGD